MDSASVVYGSDELIFFIYFHRDISDERQPPALIRTEEKLFRSNIWYINHFAAICDSLSKGYIIEATLMEALDMLISIHEPRFVAIMEGLTTYQASLLKAILEGHQKFSSAEVINRYCLNSSANVKRLKEALCKKEIITFEESDDPFSMYR